LFAQEIIKVGDDMEKFTIKISENEKKDLSAKLSNIRWPKKLSNNNDVGIDIEKVKSIVDYWLNDYDWNGLEKHLNQFNNFVTDINHQKIHFIYEQGQTAIRLPLILLHGWPDSILRYTKVINKLKEGFEYHGNKISFDVIVPSLPGFGFSGLEQGLNNNEIADVMYALMCDTLNYDEFIVSGGDVGSGVARYMAEKFPSAIKGLHLTDVGIIKELIQKQDNLTNEELDYQQRASDFFSKETGYMSIQSTKPQTLAYGLNDSPAGLIAWIGEKYFSWSGDNLVSMEDIIHNVFVYWHTQTIATSINVYLENANRLPQLGHIEATTGLSLFSEDIMLPPYAYVEKNYNLVYYNKVKQGGHFAASEVPNIFIQEIINFVKKII
jgi:pimeloyl-ACP methyl ester carboxylesterase